MESQDNPTPAPAKPKGRLIYKMKVSEVRDYNPYVRELFLKCEDPTEFNFRSGQFVMLHVPDEGGKPALRAYSIATDDRVTGGYRLIFKAVDGGLATNYVWALKGGETLDFTGPFGRLFFNEPPTEQIVFLNTGSGVSQHYCYIESNADKYPDLKYRLLFGVRTEQDIYYVEELEKLKSKVKNFSYEFILSRPSAEWKGRKGYVQNFIEDFDYMNTPTTFYMCGNGAMIKDVKAKLAAENFNAKLIFAEAFD